MSYIGTNKVGKMYLGSTAIGKAYLGSDLVYDSAGGSVTPVLPYDAEIEYLQTSGTQYIDTGIVQNTRNFELTLVLQWTGSTASDFESFFGYSNTANSSTPRFNVAKYQSKWMFGTTATNITSVSVNGNKHTFFVTGNASTNKETLYIDGTSTMTATMVSTGLSTNTLTHWLCGRNDIGSLGRPSSAKFYSLKYKKFTDAAHTTVLQEWDFIPVRIGTTGYMYDKISGTLFGNGGSGDFTLGNDVSGGGTEPTDQKITVYNRAITTQAGTAQYWVYFDLVLGAQYKIDFVSNGARNGGYIRVSVTDNGQSSNVWADSGSLSFTYSSQISNERISVYLSSPQAGTVSLTITETIGA